MATKKKAPAKKKPAAKKTVASVEPEVTETETLQTTVSEPVLHQHPDANNFGASHDESEERKRQKRAENGYSGL